MSSGLFDDFGGADPSLTGLECRILRAMLTLERRHIAILAEFTGTTDVDTDRVTQWERSKGRGYPPALVTLLRDLIEELQGLGRTIANATGADADGRWTITRPGPIPIAQSLEAAMGRDLTTAEHEALTEGSGDFWQRLMDVIVIEAARIGRDLDNSIHVEFQKT